MSAVASVVLCLFAAAGAPAQQAGTGLPATLPTHLPAQPSTAAPARLSAASALPANIVWSNGTLTISSAGTTLSDTLRQVGLTTGLRIEGSAGAEPIFGTYGPGSLDEVIDALLEGLPLNILIDHTGGTPTLTLTPRAGRAGRASPPSALAATPADPDADLPPTPLGSPNRIRSATAPQPTPAGAPAYTPGGAQPPSQPPRGTTAPLPPSPNGVMTPEQLERQLQQLRGQGAPVQP